MANTLLIGLTGGIASGKSTVASLFASHGEVVIDTDHLARKAVRRGSDGLAAIVSAFGKGMLDADGELNRAALAQIVFADTAARRTLEEIVHPRITALLAVRLAKVAAPYTVLVVPLLVETGMDRQVDRVVAVDLPEEAQLRRVVARDGLSSAQAKARITSQIGRAKRCSVADDIIDNSGPPQTLPAQVARLHRQFLALCQHRPRSV